MRRVFDCFTFFNEFEVLDLRIKIHDSFVDYYIVAESKKTWTLQSKELELKKQLENRYPHIKHKFILLDATEELSNSSPWDNEQAQRNYLINGLPKDINNTDIIIISDVDELISKKTLDIFVSQNNLLTKIEINFFYYNLRWKVNEKWDKVFVFKGMFFLNNNGILNYNEIRSSDNFPILKTEHILGAHLSFFYADDYDMYIKKVKSYSHTEYERPFFLDKKHLKYCILFGSDIFCREKIKLSFDDSLIEGITNDMIKATFLPKKLSLIQQFYKTIPFMGYMIKKNMYLKHGIYSQENGLFYWIKTYIKHKLNFANK